MHPDPDASNKTDAAEPVDESFERLKFKRDCLWQEMSFRRERQWKIFAWASGLMLTVLAGFMLLASRPGLEIHLLYRCIIIAVTLLLFLFSVLRIHHERSVVEHHASQMWAGPYRDLGIQPDRWAKSVHFGDLGFPLIVTALVVSVASFGPTQKKTANEPQNESQTTSSETTTTPDSENP